MKILGIDYGRKKIGVAVGDTTIKLAEPLGIVKLSNCELKIRNVCEKEEIKKIVVGLPDGKMDGEIKRFGEALGKQTGLEVDFFDETLTTQDAQRLLIESGGKRKLRKQKEDAVAAALMLQYYLEGGHENV